MKFKVCKERCDECLFSPGKVVDEETKRKKIERCLRDGSFFVCHKYGLERDGELTGEDVCCRGFYDSYGDQINLIRIARRLKVIEEVDVW